MCSTSRHKVNYARQGHCEVHDNSFLKKTENGVTKQDTGGTLMLLHSTPLKGMRSEMSSNLELKGKINVCSKGSRPQAIISPIRPQNTE
jgi:hypothetical protein